MIALNTDSGFEVTPIGNVSFSSWDIDRENVQISARLDVTKGTQKTLRTAKLSSVIAAYDVEHELVDLTE